MADSLKPFTGWKLSQRRYNDGVFILSQLVDRDEVTALDARYYVEEKAGFVPTKQGFRVYLDMFDELERLLSCSPKEVNLYVLRKVKRRTLLCSYCDDKYGMGIDFRYHKHTPEFTGRENRGIRLTLDDVQRLKSSLINSRAWRTTIDTKSDLFASKPILMRAEKVTAGKVPKKSNVGFIDPGLASLMESL